MEDGVTGLTNQSCKIVRLRGAGSEFTKTKEKTGVVRRWGIEDPRRGLGVWVEWALDYRLDFELSS